MGTESRDGCTQPGNCQDQDKGHFNSTVTECTQVQGLAPQSPTGSARVCPWETKSIPGKGVFSFQTRKAAKPQHMPIPRPWPQQHSRLVALGHEVLSHLARPRLRAQPAQGGRRAAPPLAGAPGAPEARARPPPHYSEGSPSVLGWGCVCVLSSLALLLAEPLVQ